MTDARKHGVETYRGDLSDLEAFAEVVALTEERKQVALRSKDYFKKLMETYGDQAYLHLAKLNITQKLSQFESQLKEVEEAIQETQPHQKKRLLKLRDQEKSLQRYISEFQGFSAKYPEEVVIAGILSIAYGNVMEMLYAGMNEDFKKCYPQYLLYPKVFEEAYQDGIVWANMGGIEGDLQDGLTKFKSHFNPTIEEFIGEFTIPVSYLYYPAELLYRLRKYLRHKH